MAAVYEFFDRAQPIISIGEMLNFMTHTFADWLLGKDDRGAGMYDFSENRSLWKTKWFPMVLVSGIIVVAYLVFVLFL